MKYIKGIKKSVVDRLNEIEGTNIDKYQVVSEEILNTIADITEIIGKEVAVFIDRRGEVIECAIGDENTVAALSLSYRRNEKSLSGVRCIHTHPSGAASLSEIDLATLIKLKYDMMVAVGVVDAKPHSIGMGVIGLNETGLIAQITPIYSVAQMLKIDFQAIVAQVETHVTEFNLGERDTSIDEEVAILVGVDGLEDLDELEELLKTSGGRAIARLVQNIDKVDKAHYIGSGKLRELALMVQAKSANLVVFDEELSGIQVKNIEAAIGVKVIDRTQLILDIFAQRARTKEGKLQVELAQMKYNMPRLMGMGQALSRTGAGIGARGPGEKKLEVDRRRVRDRVNELENELKELEKRRNTLRNSRNENDNFQVCIVGYTNAGKSTLLNALADSDIYAMDQLFATLDPTTRRVMLKGGKEVLITDTVGFIRKLPHDLIAAFKSTLEEVVYAGLLLHVFDASNSEWAIHCETVDKVIAEIGGADKKNIIVINKIDNVNEEEVDKIASTFTTDTVKISAKKKIGLEELLAKIEIIASKNATIVEIKVPYTEGNITAYAHENAKMLEERFDSDGVYMRLEINNRYINKIEKYKI